MSNTDIKILILEDNSDDLALILLELDKAEFNYRYEHAADSNSYEQYLSNFSPDIILSDYNIPGYDIFKAMEALKSHKLNIPFILITGAIDDESAVELIVDQGVSDYILKDSLSRLVPAILREYENYKTQQELALHKDEIEKLSLVASHSHNGVIIANENKLVEWVNKAYTVMTGFSLDESIGKSPGEMLQGPETDHKTVERIREKLDAGINFTEEILNYRKNGDKYWIRLNITPVNNENGSLKKYIAIQEDITEQKKAEFALDKSLSNLKKAQEIGKIGNWAYDIKNDEVYWSDEIYRIYERDFSLGPPSFEEIQKTARNNENHEALNYIDKAIKYGTPYDIEAQINYEQPKYIRAIGQAVLNDNGNVVGLEGTVQDITESKLAQEEALKSSKQLDDIVNSIEGVLLRYVLHPDGTDSLLYVSDGAEKLYGITKEEVLNDPSSIWENIHPDDVEKLQKSIEESAASLTPWRNTSRHFIGDGKMKYLQGHGTPSKTEDGDIIWNTVTMDVTEQAIVEQNQNELQELLNTSINEVYIISAETRKFVYCNEAAMNNLGYSKEELGKLSPIDIIDEYSSQKFEECLQEAESEDGCQIEAIHVRKDGSTYHVLSKVKKEIYRSEAVYVGHILDITELVQHKLELEKTLHEKEILIQEINHRVKNNLAIISGLIELQIIRGNAEPSLIDTKNRIHTIAAVHEQLYNTTRFSKVKVSKYFKSLIDNSMDTYVSNSENIDIVFNTSVEEININEAVPLGLLLNELVTNSVKHAFNEAPGTIKINIDTRSDSSIYFSYSDSGKGFDQTKFKKISDDGQGFGLELITTLISQLTDEYKLDTSNTFNLQFEFERKEKGSYSNL